MTTPATNEEARYILDRLIEQDGLTESEQLLFDMVCDVLAEGYAAASEVDESETIAPK